MRFRRHRFSLAAFATSIVIICGQGARAADRIHYIVSLASPEKHLVQVTIEIPPGQNTRELQLPVWNALYQVRDFSQYMNWIRADAGGKPLQLIQLNKSRYDFCRYRRHCQSKMLVPKGRDHAGCARDTADRRKGIR